jgi:hypothetical protein
MVLEQIDPLNLQSLNLLTELLKQFATSANAKHHGSLVITAEFA